MGAEWRKSYQSRWDVYDIFSKREDAPDIVWSTVKNRVNFNGKIVFEMGCGTGKYTKKMAPLVKHLYANDISETMIEKTRDTCCDYSNISYICESADKSGLPDCSVDLIFSAWGYVAGDFELACRVEKEFARILKPGGEIWLVDNYYEGQFTTIRGKALKPEEDKYSEKKLGYSLVEVIPTYFLFESVEEAAGVFGFLFGDYARETIIANNIVKIEDSIALIKKCIK